MEDLLGSVRAEISRKREDLQKANLITEDLIDTRRRLQELELEEGEKNPERQRNELKEALENVDAMIMNEMLQHGEGTTTKYEVKYTWRDMQQLGLQLGKDDSKDAVLCRRFLRHMLTQWGSDLEHRDDELKQSSEGRLATATFTQTEGYLKPLFKMLKTKQVSFDVLFALREIVEAMLHRDYISANDAYLRLAIGNAAWPIGVTNVGIHSRTGRERIFSQKIAHVLNDETQRKYIHGIKRLMTFAQKRYPNVPSKCLEFNGIQQGLYPISLEGNEKVMKRLAAEEEAVRQAARGVASVEAAHKDEDEEDNKAATSKPKA
ncbi:uncharacterized protein MONBRDRAFT_10632 [Monosiga brevicollis MX1]|uniref:Pre-mRNA-splicing factor 18 n=1 Tax=Monosiga brevicollis TaxID=81824 RepID=A9V6H9_MONBE|nr:uncharacterized protein MONBRDRAFT_10632 [Monosiga brevicollis MX1]EDQ86887.1 predicted protein [Monosiga brevicollis MX1]|eukprot:XP_001748432.1 hypothetical protein [Monosiga brevicollis MX1]